jgi:hypothetical protein
MMIDDYNIYVGKTYLRLELGSLLPGGNIALPYLVSMVVKIH